MPRDENQGPGLGGGGPSMVVCWSERIRANIVLVLVLEIRGINRALRNECNRRNNTKAVGGKLALL